MSVFVLSRTVTTDGTHLEDTIGVHTTLEGAQHKGYYAARDKLTMYEQWTTTDHPRWEQTSDDLWELTYAMPRPKAADQWVIQKKELQR